MVSPVVGCIIGDAKCAKFGALFSYAMGTNVCGVKADGGVYFDECASFVCFSRDACQRLQFCIVAEIGDLTVLGKQFG